MLIDTHCHLDASEFDTDRAAMIAASERAGVQIMVVPSVGPDNFETVRRLAHAHTSLVYALGVHPLFVSQVGKDWRSRLHADLTTHRNDPRLVAIGEIGLDHFVPGIDRDLQEEIYVEQLRLAVEFDLPVLLHVRRAQDQVLKFLRRVPVPGGIAHAFNGSDQQARQFIDLGFALGFGGAMTFARARQIRRLAGSLPSHAHVLETDSPDISPEWIAAGRNDPSHLPRIAAVFAELRDADVSDVLRETAANARRVMPALDALLTARAGASSRPDGEV